ncbi:pilus assembly protein CpaB [Sphingomonas sp. Leaf231]|uniref:Flp pilus assembly protein CpaB n=1 Tax=Sphingomonas sp. Leaf231 TaxID=1736301 RepID=UPI0006FE3042|nr:Flp pilus assembly protein CpaB [Sphingomonas sp. Leaf231]KQN93988.1 pilus assembly protein CpaB [Sphingomonas sp. Leaf231]
MDSRKLIMLVGALFVAALTAFAARSMLAGSPAPEAQAAPVAKIDGPEVLVATRALPVGTILDASALKFQPWPKDLVENAYYLREATDMSKLIGTVVRLPVTAGQPLTQGQVVKPGDRGFLAAALGAGMRAVTVPVSAQTSVAGFVFPGDHIDLILTQSVEGDGPPLRASETVMRNLRVLATDQRTTDQKDDQGNTIVQTFSTITVEATPKIAEQIAVAQTIGTLSLSLRSLADNASELDRAIASGAVSVGDGKDAKAEEAMLDRLANTPQTGNTTFAVGADVSRFQRRTAPAARSQQPAPANVTTATGPATSVMSGSRVRVTRGNAVTEVSVAGKN